MRVDVLTLFPEMFPGVFNASILGRAQANGKLTLCTHDIRAFSANKHKTADDYPFGGGAGMVLLAQPVVDCLRAIEGWETARRIYLSPRGKILTPDIARELANESRLILLCGHYEGIDERILTYFPEQISVGDYVLTGGELPAMVLIDCVARFIPGTLGSSLSAEDESFSAGLLEYPQYTRPAMFEDMEVPEILLSGHHAKILAWRRLQALLLTRALRPDLFEKAELTKQDRKMLEEHDGLQEKP